MSDELRCESLPRCRAREVNRTLEELKAGMIPGRVVLDLETAEV